MITWRIDRDSKVPLYLQLRDLIKYLVSTGAIRKGERLPGVVELARKLHVNFETVRKAYKEAEKEGLLQVGRGRGTFAGPAAPSSPSVEVGPANQDELLAFARQAVGQLLARGLSVEAVRGLFERATLGETGGRYLVFTECNRHEVETIAPLLQERLGLPVRGVVLPSLRQALDRSGSAGKPLAVVTTGFHLGEVRRILADTGVEAEAVVTNMSPETRRTLERFPKDARFGFICRDEESIPFYHDMLKAELGLVTELGCAPIADVRRVKSMIGSLDVALTSPPVFEQVRKLAAARVPVFNVLDRVDPVSLLAIRERLYSDWRRTNPMSAREAASKRSGG